MKKKNLTLIVSVFVLISSIALTVVFAQSKSDQNAKLSFQVKTNKSLFVLGEPVRLETQIFNDSKNSVKVQPVIENLFRLFISKDGKTFVNFVTPKSARFDGIINFRTLESGQTSTTNIMILWHGKPDYSGLDDKRKSWYQERDKNLMIVTDYAFPESGIYFVKFKSNMLNEVGEEVSVESEPAQIIINDPTGEDLEVWNKIQGKQEIALLMQGAFLDNQEKNSKMVQEVENILTDHPYSIYSSYLRQGLDKLKTAEKK